MFEWRWVSPGKRKDLFGKLPEQGRLGGVGEHQHHVDVTRPQLDQVAGVRDVRQLRHFHKVLPGRTAADQSSDKVSGFRRKRLERRSDSRSPSQQRRQEQRPRTETGAAGSRDFRRLPWSARSARRISLSLWLLFWLWLPGFVLSWLTENKTKSPQGENPSVCTKVTFVNEKTKNIIERIFFVIWNKNK